MFFDKVQREVEHGNRSAMIAERNSYMQNKIQYMLMDPSGNRTILVETPIPVADQPEVAAKLMETEPTAEQVGFLMDQEPYDISLRMAGGEFCGNATMSAAVWYCMRKGLTSGKVTLKVSGAPGPVHAEVSEGKAGHWQGKVEMPQPESVRIVTFPEKCSFPVVFFPGISHVIMEGIEIKQEENIGRNEVAAAEPKLLGNLQTEAVQEEKTEIESFNAEGDGAVKSDFNSAVLSKSKAEKLAKSWCEYLKADALGLMFLDRKKNSLTPLVYVPEAGTLYWESACGSGTCAVGAWLASETTSAAGEKCIESDRTTSAAGEECIESNRTISPAKQNPQQPNPPAMEFKEVFRQPGGTLGVNVSSKGRICLTGTVRCIKSVSW